jgi:hypothetical protein
MWTFFAQRFLGGGADDLPIEFIGINSGLSLRRGRNGAEQRQSGDWRSQVVEEKEQQGKSRSLGARDDGVCGWAAADDSGQPEGCPYGSKRERRTICVTLLRC